MAERLHLVISHCAGTFPEALVLPLQDFERPLPLDVRLRVMIVLSFAEQVVVLVPEAPLYEWLVLKNSPRPSCLGPVGSLDPLFPLPCVCLEALDRDGILMAAATAKNANGVALDHYNVQGLTVAGAHAITPDFMARNRFISERLSVA